MKALVDGDILIYMAGHTTEETYWEAYEDENPAPLMAAPTKKELLEALINKYKDKGIPEHIKFNKVRQKGQLDDALLIINVMLQKVRDVLRTEDLEVYISKGTNFRHDIATTRPYKGNRTKDSKPLYYKELKEYMLSIGTPVIGIEADDMMGIRQMELTGRGSKWDMSCICSIDKDMNTVPGWHYNWQKDIVYFVDWRDADLWLACQMLLGDSTDNIYGIKGYGKIKVFNTFKDCDTTEEAWREVERIYLETYGEEEGIKRFRENLRLLGILQSRVEIAEVIEELNGHLY